MPLFRSKNHRGRPVMVEETEEARHLETQARNNEAVALVDEALAAQSDLEPDDRDLVLIDLCLSLRSALAPAPAGSQVVSGRAPVPVIPGRWDQ